MSNFETSNEIKMDVSNLYREETFTDNTVGTLRRITPVTADGEAAAKALEMAATAADLRKKKINTGTRIT